MIGLLLMILLLHWMLLLLLLLWTAMVHPLPAIKGLPKQAGKERQHERKVRTMSDDSEQKQETQQSAHCCLVARMGGLLQKFLFRYSLVEQDLQLTSGSLPEQLA